MKAILMSIRPRHICNILNLIKWREIRKKFPKDYVGWVYIYCTKRDSLGRIKDIPHDRYFVDCVDTPQGFKKMDSGYDGKGKVVARFWCDKVEEIFTIGMYYHETKTLDKNELPRLSCLSRKDLDDYLQGDNGYAIHITKLEIFDKPKEISEFYKLGFEKEYNQAVFCLKNNVRWKTEPDYVIEDYQLTRAPQSWCYVEV